MAAFRRGFKSACDRLVIATRTELGIAEQDRLDVLELAKHLGVSVRTLTSLKDACPGAVNHLRNVDPGAFSAAMVVRDDRRLLVVNDAHTAARQANSMAHELAHGLLGHEPAEAFDAIGARLWRPEDELEADWLGGCLLVPTGAVLPVMRRYELSLEQAAEHFGVSVQLMRQRFNLSGARTRLNRQNRQRRAT